MGAGVIQTRIIPASNLNLTKEGLVNEVVCRTNNNNNNIAVMGKEDGSPPNKGWGGWGLGVSQGVPGRKGTQVVVWLPDTKCD